MKTNLLGLLAAGLLASPMSATALGLAVDFSGSGLVAPVGPPGDDGNLPLAVFDTGYSLMGEPGWTLTSFFTFNLVTGSGAGSFEYSNGVDALSGTVLTQFNGAGFDLDQTVETGLGKFAGFVGWGSSVVTLLGDPTEPPTPFVEEGTFYLHRVPEPGTVALLGLGIAGLGFTRRRQLN
jgi:hypothetical protein